MDPSAVIESISKHLDVLEKISDWAVFVSLALAWAGVQKKDISALGMTFARKQAFTVAVTIYLFVNMGVLIPFLRLGDLLLLLDAKNFVLAVTKLTTHTWAMNPFAFFGNTGLSRFYNSGDLAC